MPGRILIVPGLFRDDGIFLEQFAHGAEEDRALFATRSLLERWRMELLGHLPNHALGGDRLMLFTGLARFLLGSGTPRPTSDTCRRTVMALTLARLLREGKLTAWAPLADSPALARDVLISLGELKRGLVPRAKLDLLGREDPSLADLALIWREYDAAMAAIGEVDADELLAKAVEAVMEQLKKTPLPVHKKPAYPNYHKKPTP